jgi:transcriptional regulator with XRE-family HTH domain
MDSYNLQRKIFEIIETRSQSGKDLKDELAQLLSISKGAIYKRINSTTAISLSDLAILMKTYNISFDQLVFPDQQQVTFQFPQLEKKIVSFFEYTHTFKAAVDNFASLPNAQIYYATNELPFFYYFLDKNLTYFKFYIYAKTVWSLESYKNRNLSLREFSEEFGVMNVLEDSLKTYYDVLPNIEFWNENVLNNTLNQITYFLHAGHFELPEEAFILCDKLAEIMDHVEKMAEHGKKFMLNQEPTENSPEFSMYYNEISHTNNMLLIENDLQSAIFTAYDNPNYIISTDKRLVDYTLNWFKSIQKSSLPISKDAERTRKSMFRKIHKKINSTRSEIESILAE